eukprot:SAG31_NODE_47054_length_251_cov_35.927632_1_plen_68_part_01
MKSEKLRTVRKALVDFSQRVGSQAQIIRHEGARRRTRSPTPTRADSKWLRTLFAQHTVMNKKPEFEES